MENNKKLTFEEKVQIMDAIKETETEDDKLVASLPSNNGNKESEGNLDPITEEAIVAGNVVTGAINILNDREVDKKSEEEFEGLEIDNDLKKLLTMEDDELYEVPESLEEIPITEDMLKDTIKQSIGLNDEETKELIPILQKYMAKIPASWYDMLPKTLKLSVNKQCMEVNNTSMEAKNLFASEILDTIVRDTRMDKIVIDVQKSVSEAFNISPLMEMIVETQKTAFETELDKKIDILTKKAEESDNEEKKKLMLNKVDQLSAIKNAFYQSYTYEDMIAKIKSGKLRVKKIDIDKYKKHCKNFNYKYEQDTPFIIHDVSMLVPVIKKKLGHKYDNVQIAKFVIAFIKYTRDMKATDVVDHTFMSYFISNILNLTMITDTSSKSVFSTTLLSNICKGINAINNLD